MQEQMADLLQLEGKEIILRFADHGVNGMLAKVEQHHWGVVLHLTSRIGDHYVPYPGSVLQLVVPRHE